MNVSRVQREQDLIDLIQFVRENPRHTVRTLAVALGLPRSTMKQRVRDAVLIGALQLGPDREPWSDRPGPPAYFVSVVQKEPGA